LGAILLGMDGGVRTYLKMHLGGDEGNYFTAGDAPLAFATGGHTVGLAICADAARPSHPRAYADAGAEVYAAGVFLNAAWYETDVPRLAGYAARHGLLVLMANQAAAIGTYASVGRSAAWAPGGALLSQASGAEPCLLVATRGAEVWRAEAVGL
jgi:predicted amidohydrolase